MSKGRAKTKIKRKLRKKLNSLEKGAIRKPIAPPTKVQRTKKEYTRKVKHKGEYND